jgi:hypothetical protein
MVKERTDLMIVGNFTPDAIDWMHIGISGTLGPGETAEMSESRAKHILNKFARRGLVQMQFGDDVESKTKQSMAEWTNFWEQQITQFNQHNEDQKEKGNRYARPTAQLKEKAILLGLELLQPWRIEAKDSPELKRLQQENVALRETVDAQTGQINTQTAQIQEILDMLKTGKETEEPQAEPIEPAGEDPLDVVATNRKKYASLTVGTMSGWLKNNWEEIQEMPEENRFEIKTRYESLYQTPFPEEKPA